ncbi:uncharacterized protein LOC144578170 [Callithrix jacchus]
MRRQPIGGGPGLCGGPRSRRAGVWEPRRGALLAEPSGLLSRRRLLGEAAMIPFIIESRPPHCPALCALASHSVRTWVGGAEDAPNNFALPGPAALRGRGGAGRGLRFPQARAPRHLAGGRWLPRLAVPAGRPPPLIPLHANPGFLRWGRGTLLVRASGDPDSSRPSSPLHPREPGPRVGRCSGGGSPLAGRGLQDPDIGDRSVSSPDCESAHAVHSPAFSEGPYSQVASMKTE